MRFGQYLLLGVGTLTSAFYRTTYRAEGFRGRGLPLADLGRRQRNGLRPQLLEDRVKTQNRATQISCEPREILANHSG